MSKRWFVIHTYSGYENKVKNDLEHRIDTYGVADQIVDIQIPTEEITEVKEGGKRETRESKVFPGYVLVRMECDHGNVDDELWQNVRNTPGVTGFVGIDGKPTPLRRSEYSKIMRRTNPASVGAPVTKHTTSSLEAGMSVRVVSGPLADFDGTVSEVMADAGKVKVMLTIFGRETPVELTLDQVVTII
jgi:transcriptional antiterminator NusG